MDYVKLFKMQEEFDKQVAAKAGPDVLRLSKKVIALVSEVGELMNEIRVFKFWSEDREPRREAALLELADCFHFLFSIGLEIGIVPGFIKDALAEGEELIERELKQDKRNFPGEEVTVRLIDLGAHAGRFFYAGADEEQVFFSMLISLLTFARVMGFSESEIEQAFIRKDAINRERQESGY